jgi:hypothetical protein
MSLRRAKGMDMKVRMLFRFIVLAANFLSRERFAAAQEIEADQSAAKATFIHPGGWHTVADIKRVRTQLAANAQPWAHARDILLGSGPKQDYKPEAVATVTRGTGGVEQGGNAALQHEASDAYTLMIKWIATDDPAYADAAIRIIDAWSEKLMAIRGSDARLAAGIYGNKFAQAARSKNVSHRFLSGDRARRFRELGHFMYGGVDLDRHFLR